MQIEKVYGPPGCGKTTYCIDIVKEELARTDPDRIAYVSFTREGAYSARDRSREKFGFKKDDLPYFRTLHSLAFREGGFSRGTMMQRKDYRKLSEGIGMNFSGYYTEELQHNDDRYLQYDFMQRSNPAMAEKMLPELDIRKLEYVQRQYRLFKQYFGLFDYTDLITEYVKVGEPLDIDVAIIDEAQDLTPLQWDMASHAFSKVKRLYIAGDDDQAIYEWNGADVKRFLAHPGNIRILDQSYRLPDPILNYSKKITAEISTRQQKDFHGTGGPGAVHFITSLDEVDMTSGTWMLLSRNNKFLPNFEAHLRSKGYVWSRKGKLSFSAPHIKAINEWSRAQREGEADSDVIMAIRPYIGHRLPSVKEPWFKALNLGEIETEYYRNLLANKTDLTDRRIRVDTIHRVKGGEAENVVLILDVTRPVHDNCITNPDAENRVYYTGVTRAKQNLYIIPSSGEYGYGVY